MKFLIITLACLVILFIGTLSTALFLVASPPPPPPPPRDVFGFGSLKGAAAPVVGPELRRYAARDGSALAYRFYESPSDAILIFIHGSSYHGGGYGALATAISAGGAAKVILPNLRGHYQSGRRRGDVDYIGQLEDDLVDLIAMLRREGLQGPITLGGHSSGGGLAIRFAGGPQHALVSRTLLLSPIIPTSPAVRDGTAGGWNTLHMRRIYGILLLNAGGIHGFDALPVIAFNKPEQFWDGTETLSYSWRLNASYHPHYRYADDLRALGDKALILIGSEDEANDPDKLAALFAANAPQSTFSILPHINHFGIFSDPVALQRITSWLAAAP